VARLVSSPTQIEDNALYGDLYLLIGVLVGFIYTLAASVILISWGQRRKRINQMTLGNLRSSLESIQKNIQDVEEEVWHYGSAEEERSRRWRIACLAVAGKAIAVLQSCWIGREQDATAQAVYDELLMSLKSVGVEEIAPELGDQIDENDRRYRIGKKDGQHPYEVVRLVRPGYLFKPTLGKLAESYDEIILEPALVEVRGSVGDSISEPEESSPGS